MDSLDIESNQVSGINLEHGRGGGGSFAQAAFPTAVILRLAFQSIGIIYGDMATSPLYVYASTFSKPPLPKDVLGAFSLIFYTLTLIPLLKYVFIVLYANDNGNGGTFALYSLICRHAKVSLLQNHQVEDEQLSAYKLPTPTTQLDRALKIKEALEGSRIARQILLLLTLVGTCAVIGDGVLTPAISVLSAVDGIQGQASSLDQSVVVIISIIILIALFSVQRWGTDKVGFLFAPCVVVWLFSIGIIGLFNIFRYDTLIFHGLNPYYIYDYFRRNKKRGWISLGGIVLCITGTEAMFADLGHFSVSSIQIAFTGLVYPCLLAAYMGQGSFLLKNPELYARTFYESIPGPIYWPMFAVAVAAAIIASQAMISASFSIVEQSLALGCFPRVKIVHTSSKFLGQVYVPEINWILMILCVIVTGAFQTTTLIGNAYGIAVMAVMLVTTSLLALIMLMIWQTPLYKVCAFLAIFGSVELLYFSSNLYKFDEGGWLPLVIATTLLLLMYTWHYVSAQKYQYEVLNKTSIESVLGKVSNSTRLPGIGLIYTKLVQGIPPTFNHFLKHVPAMHSVVVFVTVKRLPIANVLQEERFLVRRLGPKEQHVYRCVVRYGYMDAHKDHDQFGPLLMKSLETFIREEYIMAEAEAAAALSEHKTRRLSEVSSSTSEGGGSSDSEDQGDIISTDVEACIDVEEEIDFLENARKAGLTYLVGHTDVKAKKGSKFVKRIVVDVVYQCLKRSSRQSIELPDTSILEIGMKYYI